MAQMVKHLSTVQETWVRSLGWEDPLEKEMATHSSITKHVCIYNLWHDITVLITQKMLLTQEMAIHSRTIAWEIPWTEEPSRLQSMGSQRVRHDWASLHFTSCITKRGFPSGSDGKESACNAGDPGSIPGLGRSPGERNGYPLQYN